MDGSTGQPMMEGASPADGPRAASGRVRLAVLAGGAALLALFTAVLGSLSPLVLGIFVIVVTAGLDGVHPVRHVAGHVLSLTGIVVGIAAQVLALIEKDGAGATTAGTIGTALVGAAVAVVGVLACRAIKGKGLATAWLILPAALPLLYVFG